MQKRLLVALFVAAALVTSGAAAQTSSNALARIKSAKAINVAYSPDSLPFSFRGPNNAPAGYSIDLCNRAIAQVGRAVGEPNLKVNWLAGSVTERLQMVASGRADLECANTTQTQSRLANVDFSNLIFIVRYRRRSNPRLGPFEISVEPCPTARRTHHHVLGGTLLGCALSRSALDVQSGAVGSLGHAVVPAASATSAASAIATGGATTARSGHGPPG